MDELKKFGDLREGDYITGSDGNPVRVNKVYEEHYPETMWEIENDEGEFIRVSGNHLWYCESELDWSLHRARLRVGRKLFKNVDRETLALLEETAHKEEEVETRLIDMISLMGAENNGEFSNAIIRVASSIGHVAEETITYEDFSGEGREDKHVRTYDARRFSQQLLALSGLRRYRKDYKLIVGSVMTTEQMMEISQLVELPVVTPR